MKTREKTELIAIGEALIDFLPGETGKRIQDVTAFQPAVGGAPANVCGAFSKLGGRSRMITQLGKDPFGDKIISEFEKYDIQCDCIKRTEKANTSLAFVALKEDGNREFSFFRNPGADMLFSEEDLQKEWFQSGYALHFCSVSLGEFPMKYAHKKAIQYAKEQDMLISFDPNLRPALWNDEESMIKAVKEFLPLANIIKISDEELEPITGKTNISQGLEELFQGNVKLILYTEGAKGAKAFTKNAKAAVQGKKVTAIDTTGAGDGFMGAFLYCLFQDEITAEKVSNLSEENLRRYLEFANAFSGFSVQRKGAIVSYPTREEVNKVVENELHG
ncbi:MAG: carbohydrate kinase [Lachnospiraceae bacterium]|nr:carbohydrate kinase [Lachnospiraceae bacterium]